MDEDSSGQDLYRGEIAIIKRVILKRIYREFAPYDAP